MNDAWQQLREAHLVSGKPPPRVLDAPWPIRLLKAVGGWIAAIFLLCASVGPLMTYSHHAAIPLGLGVLLCIGSVLLLRSTSDAVAEQFGLAVTLAGLGLIIYGLNHFPLHGSVLPALGIALIAGALIIAVPTAVHRGCCAGIASGALLSLLMDAQAWPLASGLVTIVLTVLLRHHPDLMRWQAWCAPMAYGLLLAWTVFTADAELMNELHHPLAIAFRVPLIGVALECLAVLVSVGLVVHSEDLTARQRVCWLIAGLLPAALPVCIPGSSVAVALLLLALAQFDRLLLGLGLLALLALTTSHYVLDHHTPLVTKAIGLAGLGMAALALRSVIRLRWSAEASRA